jgi:hypothetical protein
MRVVEEERLRVLEGRRDPDLELVLGSVEAEIVGVDLGALELAAVLEVEDLEGVEAAAPLRPAQRMILDDAPERLFLVVPTESGTGDSTSASTCLWRRSSSQ